MRRAIQFGWIFGVGLIAYGLFYRIANIHYSSPLGWVFYLTLPVAAFLAIRATRIDRQGSLPFASGMGIGTLATAVAAAIYCVYVFFYNRFVDDSLLQTLLSDQQARITARGLSGPQLDQALRLVETFTQPGPFSVVVFLQMMVFGLLCTLILAAILRSKSPSLPPPVEAR